MTKHLNVNLSFILVVPNDCTATQANKLIKEWIEAGKVTAEDVDCWSFTSGDDYDEDEEDI